MAPTKLGALRGGSIGNLSRLVNRKAVSCHAPTSQTVQTLGPYGSTMNQLPVDRLRMWVRIVSDVAGLDIGPLPAIDKFLSTGKVPSRYGARWASVLRGGFVQAPPSV